MQRQTRTFAGTEEVDGVEYHFRVEFSRTVTPESKPKLWGAGDISGKQFRPEPDENVLAELLHRILNRANEDRNKRPPVDLVADALRKLIDVAAGMGSVDRALQIGSDYPDVRGMHERGQQRLLGTAISLYEALEQLGDEKFILTMSAQMDDPDSSQDVLIGPLPKAAPPPSPAGQAN